MACKKLFLLLVFMTLFCFGISIEAAPKGAKALFDSGEGPATGIASSPTTKKNDSVPVQKQKYVGISYELLLLTDDGQIKKVTKNRVFKSGERLIMRVMTNRSGNLKIYNLGPTGNTHLLFDDFVDAYTVQQIPKGSNFRFVGDPGTETLLIMLSDVSIPSGPTGGNVTAGGQSTTPVTQDYGTGSYGQQSSPNIIAANIEGAKRIKGGKDIVVEDHMQSSSAIVSPANNWKPVKGGAKDIVVESSQGINYIASPASALSGGGTLSLIIKLKHQ